MNKKFIIVWVIIFTLLVVSNIDIKLGGTASGTTIIDSNTFVDDTGNLIEVGKSKNKIISLYKEHTANLFYLGLGNRIIGVDEGSTFPIDVKDLPRYSYKRQSDIDKIIKSEPDLVLISPELNDKYPAFVTGLEASGIKVVSLRPSSLDDFSIYIEKLSMLTGIGKSYEKQLNDFYGELKRIENKSKASNKKVNVFVETSESGYYTTADNSLADRAISYANGINLGKGSRAEYDESSKAFFGLNNIMDLKEDIDVYLTLVGGENPGASMVSLLQKKEFQKLKAVKEKKVYELERDMVESYSFRYITGVKEFARIIHPEIYDDYSIYDNDQLLSRENFANIVYRALHTPTFINVNPEYYDFNRFSHLYGNFKDVTWQADDFDLIETVAMRSYLTDFKDDDGNEYFQREKLVTREEVASFINMVLNLDGNYDHVKINDEASCKHGAIVKKVIASEYMDLQNGNFNPKGHLTNEEFIDLLEVLPVTYENIKE